MNIYLKVLHLIPSILFKIFILFDTKYPRLSYTILWVYIECNNLVKGKLTNNNVRLLLLVGLLIIVFCPDSIEKYYYLIQSYLLIYILRHIIKKNAWLNKDYPRLAQFILVFLDIVLLYIL